MSNEIPATLWYRVSNQASVNLVRDYLNTTLYLLSGKYNAEARKLKELPIFEQLYEGKMSGGAEYKEGPLAVLLLFGLRRYLNDIAELPASVDFVQIADDSNTMLPSRFADLDDYIIKTCIELFSANGWLKGYENIHWPTHLDGLQALVCQRSIHEVAEKMGIEYYTSLSAIKQLAIAMGCIDAPIDLTVIRTDKKAAFF
ncbi:MAG: hypothetical protein MI864_25055 [Pseudomonadales bacterium]|nr:hypothetical protein [Pseudomonadales bacterium]